MNSYQIIKVVLLPLLCISSCRLLCKCQVTTTCNNSNRTQINLVGEKTVGFVNSLNYPRDYSSNENGDCRILITSTESMIKVTIIDFIQRVPRSEYTLRFYDGTSDHGSVRRDSFSLSTNKTFTSQGRSLYITHWSTGESNNAFRISYQSYTEHSPSEEGDNSWIGGVVVGVFVALFCLSQCQKKGRRNQQRPSPTPQPQQTQSPPTPLPQTQITTSEVQIGPDLRSVREDETTNRTGSITAGLRSNEITASAPVPDLISNYDVNYRSPPPPYHIAILYSEQAESEDNSGTKT